MNKDRDYLLEIKCRIERAKKTFKKISKVSSCYLLFKIQKSDYLKYYIIFVLYYMESKLEH